MNTNSRIHRTRSTHILHTETVTHDMRTPHRSAVAAASAARVHCTLDRDERGRNLSKLREHLLGALELPQRVEEAAAR